MSSLRRLQREVIKNQCYKKNGSTRGFEEAWERVHYHREADDDMKVVKKSAGKKKQYHSDNGKVFISRFKAAKSFIRDMQDKAKNKANASMKTKVC